MLIFSQFMTFGEMENKNIEYPGLDVVFIKTDAFIISANVSRIFC